MYFGHSEQIWQKFPQLVPGALVVTGVHPEADVEASLERSFERASQRLSEGSESQMPEIIAWRRAYAQMGMKPTQYRSAAEALLRRFRLEKDVPRLHPLVDLCNAISLAFALPVAVFDLAKVDRYLEVRHSKGVEQYLTFGGEIETPPQGEVIFADATNQAHARRWTFRQSRRSAVGPGTKSALIVAEGLHETAERDVPALLDALIKAVTEAWSFPKHRATLTAESPRLEFDLNLI
jgi:DNA/RNA-binding domain of Phe-tRNA-synthetase-like protein